MRATRATTGVQPRPGGGLRGRGRCGAANRRGDRRVVAEPVYEEDYRRPGPGRRQRYYRDRGVEKRRSMLKLAGGAGLLWLVFSLFGGEDESIYRDDDGYLIREDRYGRYPLGPDPDGSRTEEFE
ncbi:hypothetical protein HOP50_01g06110 [Chloropicon primus]|uniref:Uncharacterized protein n=1 Tax=Chloropicon primus TaxID=1764295 RepID=A0A5B8MCB4_9CHLO|nr:hypothetical protein A3770_01p06250 [Chloropicon primus]UPQ97320.1 hypothetical protein HOP50_01g06110 [Chloropicon primus]|eukprot:QDZ18107.1 hypothetical protein A3770_01p06250 [Chloropicon primus]